MRNLFLLAIAVLVVSSAILLRWGGKGSPALPFYTGDTAPRFTTPPPAAPVVPKPAPVVKRVITEPELKALPIPPVPPEKLRPAMVVTPPFPAAEQISMGAGEESVTGKYGSPAASAVTSAEGHIVETLVYARQRETSATVIRIVDGKVSAAYKKELPSSPPGTLVPNLQN